MKRNLPSYNVTIITFAIDIQVFAAIRDNALHIPYRNSKLTHLLQPCLGGDAKVI